MFIVYKGGAIMDKKQITVKKRNIAVLSVCTEKKLTTAIKFCAIKREFSSLITNARLLNMTP